MSVKVTQRPEYTGKYSAIDGMAQEGRVLIQREGDDGHPAFHAGPTYPSKLPIRSDVQKLLDMSDDDFERWYKARQLAIVSELNKWKLIGDVPHLTYPAEDQRWTFGSAVTAFKQVTETLQQALKHLEVIKARRGDIIKSEKEQPVLP